MKKIGRKIKDVGCINLQVTKGCCTSAVLHIFRTHSSAGLGILKKTQYLGTLKMVSKVNI